MTLPFLYQLQNASYTNLSNLSFNSAVIDMDDARLSASQVQRLESQGKLLMTYISIGEAENYRDYWINGNWSAQLPSFVIAENSDWSGNFSVKFWDPTWQSIMFARVDQAVALGYSGMYLDLVDVFHNPEVAAAYQGADVRQAMIDFVVALSEHAKSIDPSFKVVPQNAVDLLSLTESSPDVPNTRYLNAIDGIGVEDQWYDGNSVASYTSGDLQYLKNAVAAGKFVLATSYPTEDAKQEDFVTKAINAGFVPFVADRNLTGVIDPTALTIEARMIGQPIITPWGQATVTPPPNTAPVAVADSYAVTQGLALMVGAAQGVLANDRDAEGNSLTALVVAAPTHGSLVLNANGSFTYTPATGYAGPDTFTYRANDALASSAVVSVALMVAAPSAPTIASDGGGAAAAVAVDENTHAVTTVTANHAAGSALRYTIAGGADAAAFSLDANTGVLRFLTAPDREAPTDAGGDNVYDVVVRATDTMGLSDAQAIAISVRNVAGPNRTGTGGADLLNGTAEEEMINGAAGNDSINGYAGHDSLAGGDGGDLITGGDGQDTINGEAGADTLRGDGGNDKLSGGGGRDELLGGDGADTISGGAGADSIDGGADSDVISGDAGFDVLTGGAGNDRFVFASSSDIGTGTSVGTRDVIADFTKGMDLIDLGTIDADAGISGNQAFSLLTGVNAAFTGAGQIRVITQSIGGVVHTIVEGNTGGTMTPEFRLDLVGQVTLTASDFIL